MKKDVQYYYKKLMEFEKERKKVQKKLSLSNDPERKTNHLKTSEKIIEDCIVKLSLTSDIKEVRELLATIDDNKSWMKELKSALKNHVGKRKQYIEELEDLKQRRYDFMDELESESQELVDEVMKKYKRYY